MLPMLKSWIDRQYDIAYAPIICKRNGHFKWREQRQILL